MLGLLIGRKQLFVTSDTNTRFWVKALIISAIVFGPLYQLKVMLYDNSDADMIKNTVGVILDMWQKFAFTVVLVASFVFIISERIIQEADYLITFLRKDELDKLYLPIHNGSNHLFPVRFIPGSLLRIYRQPADRFHPVPVAGKFL